MLSSQFTANVNRIQKMQATLNLEPRIVSIMLEDIFPTAVLTSKQQHVVAELRQSLVRLELEQNVSNYFYLLDRGWYIRNPELQAKVLQAVRRGLGPLINTVAGDFEEHLDELLIEQEAMFEIMRSDITNFEYLESRSWFMRNWFLQVKLFNTVLAGFGDSIDVLADDFSVHVDDFL